MCGAVEHEFVMDEVSNVVGSLLKIDIYNAFHDLDSRFLDDLKSQKAILVLKDKSDFGRLLSLLTHLATVKKFSASVVLAIKNYFAMKGVTHLDTAELNQEAWDFLGGFFEREDRNDLMQLREKLGSKLYQAELEKPTYLKPEYGVDVAFEYIFKGLMNLYTHSDSTSEIVQTYGQASSALQKFAKSMKLTFDQNTIFDSKQASVLVASPFGSDLPPSVTMSAEDQVDLGIICSPDQPMITSGGWAAYGPYQQFFMISFEYDGGVHNLFSIFLQKRFDVISMFFDDQVDDDGLVEALIGNNEPRAFLAFFYFAIHYVNDGQYADLVEPITKKYKDKYVLRPKSLVSSPIGCGVNFIKLPVGSAYRLATPLNNLGLLKELHSSFFELMPDKEDKEESRYWRSLFTKVAVGGSKPQNCGTLFNSHIRGGKIQALFSNLRSQNTGLRYIKQKVRSGKTVFNVTREQASLISNRNQIKDVSLLIKKPSPIRVKALQSRSERFVYDVVGYLGAMSDLVDASQITVMDLESGSVTVSARAERNIILGKASGYDVDQYVVHLRNGIAKLTPLSVEERNVITKTIRRKLHELLRG